MSCLFKKKAYNLYHMQKNFTELPPRQNILGGKKIIIDKVSTKYNQKILNNNTNINPDPLQVQKTQKRNPSKKPIKVSYKTNIVKRKSINKKKLEKVEQTDINIKTNNISTNKNQNKVDELNIKKQSNKDKKNKPEPNMKEEFVMTPSKRINSGKMTLYQGQIKSNNKTLKTLEKKKTLQMSANESVLRSFTLSKKSINLIKDNLDNDNIVIPLINREKENNCFLNVEIQTLFHLNDFRNECIKTMDTLKKNKVANEFGNILKLYKNEQQKNKNNKDKIEPVISVKDLKNYLNEIYNCFRVGESGDPMETMGYILDQIHLEYCKNSRINEKTIKDCGCISHKYFFLQLAEKLLCPNCGKKKIQLFDKNCFIFNVLISEITNKLKGKNFDTYKLKLFNKIKEQNEIYENENSIRISGCNCNPKKILLYKKEIELIALRNDYLVINLTWGEEFPSLLEILSLYGLISVSDNINKLFTTNKSNDTFYLKSIILYGIYHYICAIYISEENRWAVIDDKTIKYINNYSGLIDSLLRNRLMPVGLIYSKNIRNKIKESEIKKSIINKDDYIKFYQFCKEVDKKRGLQVSDIKASKNEMKVDNETDGTYLNNNLFYKSILNLFDSNNFSNKEQNHEHKEDKEKNDISKNDKKNEAFDKHDNLNEGIILFNESSNNKEVDDNIDFDNLGQNYVD